MLLETDRTLAAAAETPHQETEPRYRGEWASEVPWTEVMAYIPKSNKSLVWKLEETYRMCSKGIETGVTECSA